MIVKQNATVVKSSRVGLCLILVFLLGCAKSQDESYRKLAHDYVRQGKIEAAIQALEKIETPTSDDHSWRGELLLQLGRPQFDNAAAAFYEALKLDDQNSRALYGLGLLAIFKKESVKAEDFARKALQAKPNSAHARNLLAGALMRQEKYAEAEALLLRLETDPTIVAIAKGNLGELYLRQRKLGAAEAKLKEAISHQPVNFDWHRLLGEAYLLQGKKGAALIEYRKALELLGRSPWADTALEEGIRKQIRELEEKEVQ